MPFRPPAEEKLTVLAPELAMATAPRPSPTARAGWPPGVWLRSSWAKDSSDGLAAMSLRTEKLPGRPAWLVQPMPSICGRLGPPAVLVVLSLITDTVAPV